MKITVFDTETNGIIPKNYNDISECPYMLQLASITYDTETNTIINTINEIIKISESVTIPEEITKINSIDHTVCQNRGVDISEVLNSFNKQIENSDLLVAHNTEFDINIINHECIRNNIPFSYFNLIKDNKIKIYCTMSHGTQLCKIIKQNTKGNYYKWPKLEELHMHLFGKNLKNLHDAYNDLIICLRCYMFMNYKIDVCLHNNIIEEAIQTMIC